MYYKNRKVIIFIRSIQRLCHDRPMYMYMFIVLVLH